jgi:hypothetical protein
VKRHAQADSLTGHADAFHAPMISASAPANRSTSSGVL